jgi:hypothetical protein
MPLPQPLKSMSSPMDAPGRDKEVKLGSYGHFSNTIWKTATGSCPDAPLPAMRQLDGLLVIVEVARAVPAGWIVPVNVRWPMR